MREYGENFAVHLREGDLLLAKESIPAHKNYGTHNVLRGEGIIYLNKVRENAAGGWLMIDYTFLLGDKIIEIYEEELHTGNFHFPRLEEENGAE